jgi:hypothetical protein
MKQMVNWRGARIASLVPNVLPKAEAAACVEPRSCWCSSGPSNLADCIGDYYCISCRGRVVNTGTTCQVC